MNTNQPPLNPDALATASAAARIDWSGHTDWDGAPNSVQIAYRKLARAVVSAYLTVAQPEVNSVEGKAEAWQAGFESGWAEAKDPGAFVNDVLDAKTPNPYADEEPTDGH
ncbi:hypothetical protein ACLQ8T_05640 [Glutamicibacter sp. FR1]|uniref:hypothetical protein n=1 Tax=Glutamicibacter sp. FR1 TaxID=3393744 RepID=UPI0039B0DE23